MVSNEKNYRNYGIDTLRIVAMLFVTLGHVLGQGGTAFSS